MALQRIKRRLQEPEEGVQPACSSSPAPNPPSICFIFFPLLSYFFFCYARLCRTELKTMATCSSNYPFLYYHAIRCKAASSPALNQETKWLGSDLLGFSHMISLVQSHNNGNEHYDWTGLCHSPPCHPLRNKQTFWTNKYSNSHNLLHQAEFYSFWINSPIHVFISLIFII